MSKALLVDRWRLLGRIVADPSMTGTASGAAWLMLNHLQDGGGFVFGEAWLADKLAVSRRSIERAIALVVPAYFEAASRPGRTSVYIPRITAQPPKKTSGHPRQKRRYTPDRFVANPRQKRRYTPDKNVGRIPLISSTF
jgi:hypothetical protein